MRRNPKTLPKVKSPRPQPVQVPDGITIIKLRPGAAKGARPRPPVRRS
jgi:hypothetical protein